MICAHPVIPLAHGTGPFFWCSRCGIRVRGVSMTAEKCPEWDRQFDGEWDDQITEHVRVEARKLNIAFPPIVSAVPQVPVIPEQEPPATL